jgi:hypothetical protein
MEEMQGVEDREEDSILCDEILPLCVYYEFDDKILAQALFKVWKCFKSDLVLFRIRVWVIVQIRGVLKDFLG